MKKFNFAVICVLGVLTISQAHACPGKEEHHANQGDQTDRFQQEGNRKQRSQKRQQRRKRRRAQKRGDRNNQQDQSQGESQV